MKCVEFNPQPPASPHSNGTMVYANMLKNRDEAWLMQCASALQEAGAFTNGYFSGVVEYSSDDDKKILKEKEQILELVGATIAEFIDKDYDATYSQNVEKERTVTIDVPKVKKVGLFRKEEYIEHETKVERYTEKEPVTYAGWVIERLYKKEVFGQGNGCDILNMDYCLGKDGKIYLVLTENGNLDPTVVKCICYSPGFLSNNFYDVYTAAVSGVIGVLDAIPVDKNAASRNTHITLDDDYYFNFPIDIDSIKSYPYAFTYGAIIRMIELLSETAKQKCIQKYDWMKSVIYPE